MVEEESHGVPLHGVHVEGDDGDAADCLPKPLLPPLPPPLGEDKFGGEVVVGQCGGEPLVLDTQVASRSIGLKPGSQCGQQLAPLKSCLGLVLREDDELLVLQVAGQLQDGVAPVCDA